MRILIIGGYGVFGGRLAELLKDLPNIEIFICGRNLKQATAYCDNYGGPAKVTPLCVDRNDLSEVLFINKPDIVVDASGPFQLYNHNKNGDPYTVIKSCIKAGVNYMDLADGADFVFGVPKFNVQAKEAGIFILSGVSTYPVLTMAVLKEIAKDMQVRCVKGGIAPSPFAGIGLNVMRAVISYAGGPVKLHRDGKQEIAYGLTESMRFKIAPPGKQPLNNIHFSLVDVPDLQIIPKQIKTIENIWMGAGPVPEILHKALNILAKARKKYNLKEFTRFAPLFYRVLNLMKFGEHRGGMFVKAVGTSEGKKVERTWHMIAEGDDGPYIPSMAVEGIIRKILIGKRPKAGARIATKELTLKDYDALFEGKSIYYGFRDLQEPSTPLYRHVLNTAYDSLPETVQALHGTNETRIWSGTAQIVRGKNLFANMVAVLFRFPKAATASKICVTLTPKSNGSEIWERNFDGKKFRSVQRLGTGKNEHLLMEKFGPIEVAIALLIKDDKMFLETKSWSFLGILMPKFLMPNGKSFETEENGCFVFNVEIKAPLVGLIVAYKGKLKRN